MGITSKVDRDRRIIISVCEGILTSGDWIDFTMWVHSNHDLSRYDKLVDLRRVERIDMTSEETRSAASLVPKLDSNDQGYRVAIVSESDLMYGMSRMYEIMRENSIGEVRSFRDIEQAKKWLGID